MLTNVFISFVKNSKTQIIDNFYVRKNCLQILKKIHALNFLSSALRPSPIGRSSTFKIWYLLGISIAEKLFRGQDPGSHLGPPILSETHTILILKIEM